MAKKRSMKGKGSYASYKTENRVYKNKIAKLERHCKKYPNDEEGKKTLTRVKKDGYTGRKRPLVPGSNQTIEKTKFNPIPGYLHYPRSAGEQLCEALGIKPLPPKKNFKPVIKHKPKRK